MTIFVHIEQEREINRANQGKDQRIVELERALRLNTNHHQTQINKVQHEANIEISKIESDKASQIAFLREKLSRTVQELQNEILSKPP